MFRLDAPHRKLQIASGPVEKVASMKFDVH